MFAVDIASFSRRDPDIQIHVRDALYRIVRESCHASGVSWDDCHHEDRGDGILVIVPADTSVAVLLEPLTTHLRIRLRPHNKAANTAAQIRLRMAVHAGYVTLDNHGVSGKALIQLFRMLDAPTLKSEFADHGGDLALIISEPLYDEVVKYSPGPIDPDSFRPITVNVKETHEHGWLWLPPTEKPKKLAQKPGSECLECRFKSM